MRLRFFECDRCGVCCAAPTEKENLVCGSFVGFKLIEGDERPVGCGGRLIEKTRGELEAKLYD